MRFSGQMRLLAVVGCLLLVCVLSACGGGAPTLQATPTPTPTSSPSTPTSTLAISTSGLPIGTLGQAYAAALNTTGANGAVNWSVLSGALPAGVALASESGVITGTPTVTGVYNVSLQAADSVSSVSRSLSLHVSGNGTFYHQYTKAGTYNVKVTTVDAQGNTATATQTVVVNPR
jgi:Putative Ig domain